jgi:hypothetical protein
MEESVYHSACVEQVANGTENGVGFRLDQRVLRMIVEVGPLLRYE